MTRTARAIVRETKWEHRHALTAAQNSSSSPQLIGVSSVTSLAETPADISSYNNVFNNIVASPELIIPSGYKTNYDTNGWSSYFNTVTEDNSLSNKKYTINGLKLFTNKGEVKANLINIYLEVYTVTGKKVANSNLKKGLYIVVAKNQEGKIHAQKVVL